MSVILQPQRAFPIVRQIANHLDENTYYVRAVVRDADGSVLDTVNLASQGDQRYQTSWQVPADPSGQGRYISIVTSVYTDSNYTTKSSSYGDEENTYLVFDRVMPAMRGGGGGGVDGYTVRRIVKEELSKLPEPEQFDYEAIPKAPNYDEQLGGLASAVGYLQDAIEKLPKSETDISPLNKKLSDLMAAIENKEVTPETDLEPLRNEIATLKKHIDSNRQDIKSFLTSVEDNLLKFITSTVNKAIKEAKFVSQISFPTTVAPAEPAKKEEEPEPMDLSRISR